ncbi:hypothetical protein DMUE_0753 [Dictyocoela muelleri]|nr:hypothetical protein DMUE_0753 [Dictyocoela muelleri]
MTFHYYQNTLEPLIKGPVENIIMFFRNKELFKSVLKCEFCFDDMKSCIYKRNKNKMVFRCFNTGCLKYKNYKSNRCESLFENFIVPLSTILRILWKWFNDHTQVQMSSETSIKKTTIINIIAHIRNQCIKYHTKFPIKLGGDGMIIQIDESLFRHKQKLIEEDYPIEK